MAIFVLGLPDDTMAAFKLALKVLGFIDIFSLYGKAHIDRFRELQM